MNDTEICFVIVFNHKYNSNIEKLKKIYQNRFKNIFFLVPFYDGDAKNVFPVYESSFQFQGYFAQAFKNYYKSKYDYYIFIADDLILNPKLNSNNIINSLNLNKDKAYIKFIASLKQSLNWSWEHYEESIRTFNTYQGVNILNEMPSCEESFELIKNKGFDIELDNNMPYPLYMGYSDFIIIPQKCIHKFIKLCGVFAAMNLFVETAIPTAMLLSCDKITFESESPYRGIEYWDEKDKISIEEKHNKDLNHLFNNFGDDLLYYHPIKLSRWSF